jgi:hypothetical protein
MAHLDETQLLDALDGGPDEAAAAHIASCASCAGRVGELHFVLQSMRASGAADVPEPSPLFWEHFPARVSRAIDAKPERPAWFGAYGWLWGSAAAVAVMLVLLALPPGRETGAPAPAANGGGTPIITSSERVPSIPEGIEDSESLDDEAWAMVRAVAEETNYDDVDESGLAPRAGALERAAMELTEDERAELGRLMEQDARLIQKQLKRAGTSTP